LTEKKIAKIEENKVENDTLRAQLHELNERARWYSSQIWQVPFAFLGIAALVIGMVIEKNDPAKALAYLVVSGLGIAVLIHVQGLADGEKHAVENIRTIEGQLHLEQTAEYKPDIWKSFPVVVIIVTTACLFFGIIFLMR